MTLTSTRIGNTEERLAALLWETLQKPVKKSQRQRRTIESVGVWSDTSMVLPLRFCDPLAHGIGGQSRVCNLLLFLKAQIWEIA